MVGIYRKGKMGSSGSFGGSGNPQVASVDENFSVDLYDGNQSSNQITNGVDFSTDGGLVLMKSRTNSGNLIFMDTARGADRLLQCPAVTGGGGSSDVEQQGSSTIFMQSFNTNGFTIGTDAGNYNYNRNSTEYVGYSFKEKPKFFDIVTYTGNGTNQAIAHNLDCEVGMIWIKRRDVASDWTVFHRRQNSTNSHLGYVRLNHTTAYQAASSVFNNTAPTTTHFTVGSSGDVNANNGTYVAYLFAHNDADDSIIKSGSFTTNSSGISSHVDLGFEPQFLIAKAIDNTSLANTDGGWFITDNIRQGLNNFDQNQNFWINDTGGDTNNYYQKVNATGFSANGWTANRTYIYTAIRLGGMADLPTSRASVFDADYVTNGNGVGFTVVSTTKPAFPIDIVLNKLSTSTNEWKISNRLISFNRQLTPDYPTQTQYQKEATDSGWFGNGDRMAGYEAGSNGGYVFGTNNPLTYFWKRAKGFCDVVKYDGTGSNTTIKHNLGRPPELMWIKNRDSSEEWAVYYGDATDYLRLNTDGATVDDNTYWNDTSPTATVFSVGTNDDVNHSGESHMAFLFGSVAGISKIGTFSHTNGSVTNVDCGFSSGSIFVLVKRIDSTGDWYIWDTERGITSGNDAYVVLNTNAAQVINTDFIDPLNSGFQMSSTFATGSYLFYAIAT